MSNTLSLQADEMTERFEQIELRLRRDRRNDRGFLATIVLLAALAVTTVSMAVNSAAKPTATVGSGATLR